jgi:hypothetical protein
MPQAPAIRSVRIPLPVKGLNFWHYSHANKQSNFASLFGIQALCEIDTVI